MTHRIFSLALALGACLSVFAQTQIVAHRGYWKAANGAQNSIEAFNRADSIAVYASEFDVCFTADDSLVVVHGPIVQGVDVRTAPIDSILAVTLSNGEKLPLLSQFLDNVANNTTIRLVLEQKAQADFNREDQAAAKIVEMLRERGLLDRTDIISFSINACLAYVKLCPELPVYYLDGDLSPKKVKSLGFSGIDYHHSVIREHPEWIDQCHDLGLKVNVWTVDKPEDIQYFKSLGVDFITTNNPE